MNNYTKALEYGERALEIRPLKKRKILPENHPDLATTYVCIGNALSGVNNTRKHWNITRKISKYQRELFPKIRYTWLILTTVSA